MGAGAMHCASPRHYSSPPIANPADIAAAVELVAAPDTPDLPGTDESCRGGGGFEGELLPLMGRQRSASPCHFAGVSSPCEW